ncbi:MAG: uracil-DNA glycosylase [Bacilli bacterium]|nr:uracil-DNA glycosylase [Bacilli bacterium]
MLNKYWSELLQDEIKKEYFIILMNFIENEYKNKIIYPSQDNIFKSLENLTLDKIKVVIIGQDPYHQPFQANGYAFSVSDGVKIPPSLRNIFKEMSCDIGKEIPKSGNLEYLSKQGVLLLNSVLTVQEGNPGSHQNKGWEIFTNKVIETISANCEGIIFILWGNYAKSKKSIIDLNKHHIIESNHPSPLSANRGFFGSKPFSKTNKLLKEESKKEIVW